MRLSPSSSTSLLTLALLALTPHASPVPETSTEDGTDPTTRATRALLPLQNWYNTHTGLWNTCGWWNSANVLTTIGNLAKSDPSNEKTRNLVERIFANTIVRAPDENPQPGIEGPIKRGRRQDGRSGTTGYKKVKGANGGAVYEAVYPEGWVQDEGQGGLVDVNSLPSNGPTEDQDPEDWLDGYYDDDLWWALGWINAYDVTDNTKYLDLAEGIFNAVTKAWPTRCFNGGIFWSWEKEYMNAIANELFLSTAAHLANRVSSSRRGFYIEWAERTLSWFLGSGMINEEGLINDGLTEECENNDGNTWSYNQGVILGGLVELNRAAPNSTYLPLASRIAKAALNELSDEDGVMHDTCEPNCGGDGSQFKGIFMRNLQLLHSAAPDDAFIEAIQVNADSIWENDRDDRNRLSLDWAGPFLKPANASTHSSAMDTLVAAITADHDETRRSL